MEQQKEGSMEKFLKDQKKFNPKDAILVFSMFAIVCAAVIFALIVNDVLTITQFFSFDEPYAMIIYTVLSAIGLTLFGVILTLCTPAKYIDDTNQTYQDLSVATIVGFMLVGALFEELLFRGIIQNVLNVFIHNEWTSIFVASLIFIAIHAQYFKKPIMLVNLIVPSLTFGWIYFATNNLLVPFLVHYAMNVVITLLFKYRIIAMRK